MRVAASHREPFGLAGLPLQTAQVPEAPHAPGSVPATQDVPEQQKPPLHEPLPVAPQVDVHAPFVHVGVPSRQGEQAWPVPPHAPFCVPVAQLPPLQQPPLHGVWLAPPQAAPHLWVPVSHACPAAMPVAATQSVAESHPHVSVPGSHFGPFGLAEQTAQVPDPPHAAACVPATHAPAEQQKPALQAPSPPAPQADVHAPAVQVGVPAAQGAHARPLTPQAPFWSPATHVPPMLQHPPLQAWVASHVLWHWWVAVLQDSSGAQSLALLQPQAPPLSHTWPMPEVRQSLHMPPVVPHAPGAVPATHVVPEQQPP